MAVPIATTSGTAKALPISVATISTGAHTRCACRVGRASGAVGCLSMTPAGTHVVTGAARSTVPIGITGNATGTPAIAVAANVSSADVRRACRVGEAGRAVGGSSEAFSRAQVIT